MKKYNKKIDYLFCKYGPHELVFNSDELNFKKIYNEEIMPISEYEKKVLQFKKILSYIKKEETKFNYDNLINIMLMLDENAIIYKNESLIKLIDDYNKNLCNNLSLEFFIKVVEEEIFMPNINIEMAKIIHNFIEIKNSRKPIIFYYYEVLKIIELIKNGQKENCFVYFLDLYNKTNEYNESHKLITINELTKIIKENEYELKTKYYVDKLFIFGSYSKGLENEYSDLDVYVEVFDDKKSDLNNKYYLLDYLKKILKIKVDCIVKDDSYNNINLPKDICRNLVKII